MWPRLAILIGLLAGVATAARDPGGSWPSPRSRCRLRRRFRRSSPAPVPRRPRRPRRCRARPRPVGPAASPSEAPVGGEGRIEIGAATTRRIVTGGRATRGLDPAVEALVRHLVAGRTPLLIVTDFDGTLSPIVLEPTAARIVPAARSACAGSHGSPRRGPTGARRGPVRTRRARRRRARAGGRRRLPRQPRDRGRDAGPRRPSEDLEVASDDGLAVRAGCRRPRPRRRPRAR